MTLRHLLLGVLLVLTAVIGVELVVTNFEDRTYRDVDESNGPPGAGTFIHDDQQRPDPGSK